MSKKAILLANLGSPDSPAVKDVRRYLNEFLMDERVIDIPKFVRTILVKGIIVPFRAPSSAKKYETIWTKNGSPLIHISKELQKLVAVETQLPTYLCMRYANPSTPDTLAAIHREHPDLEELVLLPLYPHYAMSSYETAVKHVEDCLKAANYSFKLRVVPPFYNQPDFINALAETIRPFTDEEHDLMLFSYHGIPERHVRKTDPDKNHCLTCENCCDKAAAAHDFCYRHQVKETTELVAEKLGLVAEKYNFSFQSRLGTDKWLRPYTAQLLSELPKQGVKKLIVACPAFVSDCLETLEEIHEEGKEDFMKAGGESFKVVPCLNLRPDWVKAIGVLVNNPTI